MFFLIILLYLAPYILSPILQYVMLRIDFGMSLYTLSVANNFILFVITFSGLGIKFGV